MKRSNVLLTLATALLIACGGGGGGGDAAKGGFQQEKKPDITIRWEPNVLIPNASGARFESLSSAGVAMVDVTVMRGNLPLETGTGDKSEVYVSVLNTGVDARLYCFDEGNDKCKQKIKDTEGNDVEVLKPLGGMNVNLNNGQGTFAVTPITGKTGFIDLRISAAASTSSVAVETVRIPVKYPSSGKPFQLNINAPDVINPNIVNKFSVIATDESGNPITDAKQNNLLVTATGLDGVILGNSGKTGASLYTKTNNGAAVISLLASQVGTVKITAQVEYTDEYGNKQLVETAKFIQVSSDKIIPLGPINITTASLPNGAVNVKYDFTIPTAGAALSNMTVESGSVPPGLTLSSAGQLTGTPVLAGDYKFTVKATGVNNTTSIKTISLKIVTGGLKFNPTGFKKLQIPAQFDCIVTSQPVIVESTNSNYKPQLPFKWHYDAGEVKTALYAGTATPLKDANGKTLTGLEITVTADTSQITMNGEACRGTNITGGYGIILGVEDANGIKFETVMPLVIGADPKPVIPVEPVPDFALPNATIGQLYNASIPNATAVSGGNVPPGLTFTNGLLQGTPTTAGSYAFTVTLQDGRTQQVTITVEAGQAGGGEGNALTLDDATVGKHYNGAIPEAVSLKSGTIPKNLTFSNGLLSGIPVASAAGKHSFVVTLSNGATQIVNLTINDNTLNLTATVGQVYNKTIPDATSITGTLPTGLTKSGGVISGTPASGTAGGYVLTATLSSGVKQTVNLTVSLPTDGSGGGSGAGGSGLHYATVGESYNLILKAQSVIGNYPDNLVLDANGNLSGNLAVGSEGSYFFTAILEGGVEKKITLVVKLPMVTLPDAKVGVLYSANLPGAQSVSAGSLPAGLTLSGTTLSGTPEAGTAKEYIFTISRSDGVKRDYKLTVNP